MRKALCILLSALCLMAGSGVALANATGQMEVLIPAVWRVAVGEEDMLYERLHSMYGQSTTSTDGRITVIMSRDEHSEFPRKLDRLLEDSFSELESGRYPSIRRVQYDDEFTYITAYVDADAFAEGQDQYALYDAVTIAVLHRAVRDKTGSALVATLEIKDAHTDEMIAQYVLPSDTDGPKP